MNRHYFEEKDLPFLGVWDVVSQEHCERGMWVQDYEFVPGEWLVAFFIEGRCSEIFRPEGLPEQITSFDWAYDPYSGVITLRENDSLLGSVHTAVYDPPYLCFFDDQSHVAPDRAATVDHHTRERWLLRTVPATLPDA